MALYEAVSRQFPQTGIVIPVLHSSAPRVDAQRLLRQIPGAIGQGAFAESTDVAAPNDRRTSTFLRSLAQAAHGGDGIPLIATTTRGLLRLPPPHCRSQ